MSTGSKLLSQIILIEVNQLTEREKNGPARDYELQRSKVSDKSKQKPSQEGKKETAAGEGVKAAYSKLVRTD